MYRLLFLLSIGLVSGSSVAADLHACDLNKSSSNVFACLDQMAKPSVRTLSGSNGRWVYTIHGDSEEADGIFIATLLSSSQEHFFDRSVFMNIRCKNKTANVEIQWHGQKLKEGEPSVAYRFDNETSKPIHWVTDIGRRSLAVDKPMDFIRQMSKTHFFMVQTSDNNTATNNATFQTKGLKSLLPIMDGFCY